MNLSNSTVAVGVDDEISLVTNLHPKALISALLRGQALVWLLGLSLAVHLILACIMPLTADEAYAVVVSRSHALSYYDHPPLAFALARLMADLTGTEIPGVLRLPFVVMGAGSTLLLYDITRRLYGSAAARWACLAFGCSPFFFTFTGGLIVPDGPLDFFLLLCVWSILPILMGEQDSWKNWLMTGAALGMAVLSKYHAVLFGVDAFIALLLNPKWRHFLVHPKAWAAVALAALGGLPVLIWNAEHGWASFVFQTGRAYYDTGIEGHASNFVTVIGGQALYLLPLTWFACHKEVWAGLLKPADHINRLLAGIAVAPIVVFDAIAVVGHHSLPHWTMSGFLFALPLVGRARAAQAGKARAGMAARALAAASVVTLLIAALAVQCQFALLTRLVPQARAFDMGWHDLDWSAIKGRLGDDGDFVVAPNWVSAGHIGLAAGTEHPIDILSDPHQFQFIDRCRLASAQKGAFVTYLPASYRQGQPIPGVDELKGRYEVTGPAAIISQTRMGIRSFDIAIVPLVLAKPRPAARCAA